MDIRLTPLILALVLVASGCTETKRGCAYGNPSCAADQACIGNICAQKEGCLHGNPACGENYECVNNSCRLKSGCRYGNPPCNDSSECIENRCLTKQGCQFGNPGCERPSVCRNSTCVDEGCNIPSDLIKTTEMLYEHYGVSSAEYDVYARPGSEIRLVCQQPCPIPESIAKKTYAALESSINNLTTTAGVDFVDAYAPLDFHYTSDSLCGRYVEGLTGNYNRPPGLNGFVCTFNYEKNSSQAMLPMDESSACRRASTLLSVHEAVHALFDGTNVTYWIQEDFAKMLSFHIAGYYEGGDVNSDDSFLFGWSACDERAKDYAPLNYELCSLYGIDVGSYNTVFRGMDDRRRAGRDVTDHVFKEILDDVAGEDTSQAFSNANRSLET